MLNGCLGFTENVYIGDADTEVLDNGEINPILYLLSEDNTEDKDYGIHVFQYKDRTEIISTKHKAKVKIYWNIDVNLLRLKKDIVNFQSNKVGRCKGIKFELRGIPIYIFVTDNFDKVKTDIQSELEFTQLHRDDTIIHKISNFIKVNHQLLYTSLMGISIATMLGVVLIMTIFGA